MNKLFLAIYFSLITLIPAETAARAVEVSNIEEARKQEREHVPAPETIKDPRIPSADDFKALEEFIKERLKTVVITELDENEDLNAANSMDVQHSAEYVKRQQDAKKSIFQKIYDNAIDRISENGGREDIVNPGEGVYYYMRDDVEARKEQQKWEAPDFDVVNVLLPNGEKILAPAKEHIAYLFSKIEILPNGLTNMTETITVVANGDKLKHGLTRVIPKYTTSRSGVRSKLDFDLISASVNGQEIPYKAEEIGNRILLTPTEDHILEPGVYTYEFNYLLDRQLWHYDDFNEFYWDIAGSSWDLVIVRIGASVSIPGREVPLSQNVFLGYPNQLRTENSFIAKGENNTLGFASTVPLFPGEGMHVIISIPKGNFEENGFNRWFSDFIGEYGDIVFILTGLASILISYILSWRHISAGKSDLKSSLRKTAPVMRMLTKGVFDKTSFAAWLLELYRKNIIDIAESGDDILLIKKTDFLGSLSKNEKKALNNLFPGKESVLTVNPQNMLKIRRASKLAEKETANKIKKISLFLNSGYLFFSVGMLLLSELAVAALGINPGQLFVILVSCTITMAFYVWISKLSFKNPILKYAVRILAAVIILFTLMVMAVYIHPVSALLILGMIYIIFAYTAIFAKRSGLLKANIKEAADYRDYLLRNRENLVLGRDFLSQQANILAFDIADDFKITPNIRDFYKLDIIRDLIRRI